MTSSHPISNLDRTVVLGARHGEVKNGAGGIYGHLPGFALSSLGRQQARALGQALSRWPVKVIYCSPLERTLETAEIVGSVVKSHLIIDERLVEWRFWEVMQGRKSSEALSAEIRRIREGLIANPDDASYGESLNQFRARLMGWVEAARSQQYGVILGVTHFDALRALVMDALGRKPDRFQEVLTGHCHVVRLHPDPLPTPIEATLVHELLENEHVFP